MRQQKPWYRDGRGWYVCVRNKQIPLGKHPDGAPPPHKHKKTGEWSAPPEIVTAFYALMAGGPGAIPPPEDLKVANVCDLFLAAVCPYETAPKKQPKASDPQLPLKANTTYEVKTYWWYRKFLQSFCDLLGGIPALDIKPLHVTAWLDAHPKWTTGRRCAVICVKRAYNWAEGEGILNANPMKKVKKPSPVRRERVLTEEEWRQINATVRDQQFRDFLFALRESGARPGEVRRVTAANINFELGVWLLAHHKTRKKTGLPRVIYMTTPLAELCKRLVVKWPTGPIFRGPRGGKPLSRNGVRCRFRRLRAKLPHLKGVISYTVRHSYATDALERGVPVATVAELMGHSDTKMLAQHYNHLSEKRKHLADAANRAAGYAAAPPEEKRQA